MRRIQRIALSGVLFVGLVIIGASPATASRGIRVGAQTISKSGVLTFGSALTCDVLMSLTLSSQTILKVTGVRQGQLGGGYIRNCTGSTVGSPATGAILGPITVEYSSFWGVLPDIWRIVLRLPNMGISVNTIAGVCLYGGIMNGVDLTILGGVVNHISYSSSTPVPKMSGGVFCPSAGQLTGSLASDLSLAPSVTLI